MDRPGVRRVPEGSGERGKREDTGCKIICGAPTTLAVKVLMMMMMTMTFCSQEEEAIGHLIWGCTKSLSFRNNLQIFIKEKCVNCTNLEFSVKFILFGVSQNLFTDKVLDLIVLLLTD